MPFLSWCPSLITIARAIYIIYVYVPLQQKEQFLEKESYWILGHCGTNGSCSDDNMSNIDMAAWWQKLAISVSKCVNISLRRREIQLHSCRALWYRALRFKISKFTKQAFGGHRPTWPETSSVLHPYFVTDRCRWRLFSHIIKYHKFPPKTSEFQA